MTRLLKLLAASRANNVDDLGNYLNKMVSLVQEKYQREEKEISKGELDLHCQLIDELTGMTLFDLYKITALTTKHANKFPQLTELFQIAVSVYAGQSCGCKHETIKQIFGFEFDRWPPQFKSARKTIDTEMQQFSRRPEAEQFAYNETKEQAIHITYLKLYKIWKKYAEHLKSEIEALIKDKFDYISERNEKLDEEYLRVGFIALTEDPDYFTKVKVKENYAKRNNSPADRVNSTVQLWLSFNKEAEILRDKWLATQLNLTLLTQLALAQSKLALIEKLSATLAEDKVISVKRNDRLFKSAGAKAVAKSQEKITKLTSLLQNR